MGSKIALPVEMFWAFADLFWLEKLHKNGLKNFEVSQYLIPDPPVQAKNGKLPHDNLYLRFSGEDTNRRQRRPRVCDSNNPLWRGRVQFGEPVNNGGILSKLRCPMARSAKTYDFVKQRQEERMTLKEAIEKEVFPTLHSFEIFKKLENGALLTQYDAYQKKMESLALLEASDPITL